MKKTILVLLVCLLASCTKSVAPETSQLGEESSLYTDEILHFIDCIKNETVEGGIANGSIQEFIKSKKGQILHIKSYTIRNSVGNPDGLSVYKSKASINLYGCHSPSTTIKSVTIQFVDNDANLTEPKYDAKNEVLYMTLKNNQMASVLASLEQPNTQWDCWYGEFELKGADDIIRIQKMAEFYRYTVIDTTECKKVK